MEKTKPWIKAKLIIEIAGFPKEHIDDALKKTAENFGKDRTDIKINKINIGIAKEVKLGNIEKTKMFSGFVEIEIDIETLSTLVGLIFDWMPSSVEIIEPEIISDDVVELNGVLNDLTGRLHQYDAAIKKLKAQTILLAKELAKYKNPEESEEKKIE